jgi:tetratricopeptide (TPR) repeat protein
MSMSARLLILVALLLCVLAPPAWADDPALAQPKQPDARSHYTQGNRLYRARKLDDAIAAYQAGAAIESAPVFDYNLGQCYRKLGRYADAIRHYERFLRDGRPGGELHELVTGFLRQLHAELDRPPVPPRPARPPPLVAAAPESASAAGRAGSAPIPAAALSSIVVGREHWSSERWYSDRVGWGLVAAGVAAAGGAAYLHVRASDLQGRASADPAEDRRSELRGAAYARNVVGTALGIGSAALIAVGAIRLAIDTREPKRPRTAAWRLGLTGRGAAVLGRF